MTTKIQIHPYFSHEQNCTAKCQEKLHLRYMNKVQEMVIYNGVIKQKRLQCFEWQLLFGLMYTGALYNMSYYKQNNT